MGAGLYILSVVLGAVLFPIGFAYGIAAAFIRKPFKVGLRVADSKLLTLAKSVDKYGNVICSELFNATLITRESTVRFGCIKNTISEVIGWNLVNGTLSKTGHALNNVLDFLDKDHSLKAIGHK